MTKAVHVMSLHGINKDPDRGPLKEVLRPYEKFHA